MYTRKCPNCKNDIAHKDNYTCLKSEASGKLCKNCKVSGDKNPFYGKTHKEESKKKILEKRNYDAYKTDEFRKKISKTSSGSNNPMYGRSVYSLWVEKYGKEEADKRLQETKNKLSKINSGNKNPMYGRPSPQGSGNGWKGWYKNEFFRSLRELTFMINNDGEYEPAGKIRIKYLFNGKERTYCPDFIMNGKLVEIKPIRLHDSPNNLAKFTAAKKYCDNNSLIFEVIDVKIDKVLIEKNLQNIKFQGDYLERFLEYVKKNSIL